MINETLYERRQIVKWEGEDDGSRLTLSCGHVVWTPLEPVYQGGSIYCGECLNMFVEQLRKTQRRA